MKNILILKFPYASNFGGGEQHTLSVVDNLSKKGFKFYLISTCQVLLSEFKKRDLPQLHIGGGIEPVTPKAVLIFPFLAPFLFFEFLGILIYFRFFKNFKTLYCLSLTEKLLATFPAALLGYKIIWVEHSMLDDWLTRNPWRYLYVLFSGLATIVCISKALADQVISLKIPEKNVKFIYPGIDLNKFTYYPKNQSLKVVVGTVSRLDKEKGIDILLKTAPEILKKYPNIIFNIVGKGKQEKALKELAEKLALGDSVKFLGFRKSVEVLKTFDILVLPSLKRESLGIILLEALSCGVPVVASQIGGTKEIIAGNEVGFLVPPNDLVALENAIIKLVSDVNLRKKMAVQGRKLIEEKFSQDIFIKNFEKLLS